MNDARAESREHYVDADTPSAARMYDYLLGGHYNYPCDREACDQLLVTAPSTRELALNNRAFLERVVRHIARRYGIRQFLDHGSGLPTQNNVHQVAQSVDPDSKVVYIDNDPLVLGYGRAFLEENRNVLILPSDMRETAAIAADAARIIDFRRPVAALFVSVLHCVPDDDRGNPRRMVEDTVRLLAPGSVVVICQLVSEDARIRDAVTELMREQTGGRWGRVRTKAEVAELFTVPRLRIEEEVGLLDVTDWRPDTELVRRQATQEWIEYGGLATVH
ncbi:SAM-dependent methyltransferase [Kitasatospora purpeofusca]|uniref:SAM-dependent methyltransferase n=1 Tax=Kitasatospora purpeofusca TaxID=67352 RepID=UPI0004C1885E|nr:SAM-dependent methyltransferase [Kitasatospora purpeofusca]